mgnify:CR=1 FL=1
MFVLDTNVISELRQGKPNPSMAVRQWAAGQPSNQLFLSAITLLELEFGIQALERKTPPQGSALRHWLGGVRAAFAGRILPFAPEFDTKRAKCLISLETASKFPLQQAQLGIRHGLSDVHRRQQVSLLAVDIGDA